jgi:hypothetical protein
MKNQQQFDTTKINEIAESDSVTSESCERPDRRAVLEKLGALAAYTPPIMLGLMVSRGGRADFGSNPPPP